MNKWFVLIFLFFVACGSEGGDSQDANLDPVADEEEFFVDPAINAKAMVGSAVLSGRVLDQVGNPVNGLNLRLVLATDPNVQTAVISGMNENLDGAYSMQNLPAGSYYLILEELDGQGMDLFPERIDLLVQYMQPDLVLADQYYVSSPGVTEILTLAEGETTAGIDFVVAGVVNVLDEIAVSENDEVIAADTGADAPAEVPSACPEILVSLPASGQLQSGDEIFNNRYTDCYALKLNRTENLTLKLTGSFDMVFMVYDPIKKTTTTVDDYYGSTTEKLATTLEAGSYTLTITSYYTSTSGAYVLSVDYSN